MATNSQVPRIQLNDDDSISLVVDVYGFDKGTQVEISGEATQANGAVAVFYSTLEMPEHEDGKPVPVTLDRVKVRSKNKFAAGFTITVVARAAEAWSTMLVQDGDAVSATTNVGTGIPVALWKDNGYDPAKSDFVEALFPGKTATTAPLLRYGTRRDRVAPDPLDGIIGGSYTRLFPNRPRVRRGRPQATRPAMTAPPEEPGQETGDDPEENPGIPAAYTYLGQFVDHDLTFDPISRLRGPARPASNAGRFPNAPFRPRQPVRTRAGRPALHVRKRWRPHASGRAACRTIPSTQARSSYPGGRTAGRSSATRATTRTASSRNCTPSSCGSTTRSSIDSAGSKNVSFAEVRQYVRWHYQWILVNDFLPKSCNSRRTIASSRIPMIRLRRYPGSGRMTSSSCPWSFRWPPTASGTP